MSGKVYIGKVNTRCRQKYKQNVVFTFSIEFLIIFPYFVRGLTNTRLMGEGEGGYRKSITLGTVLVDLFIVFPPRLPAMIYSPLCC